MPHSNPVMIRTLLAVCLPLLTTLPAHAASIRTSDGEKPRVDIVLPSNYHQNDFPLGTKTFRLDTNIRKEDIERIWWSLDSVRGESGGESLEMTFTEPSTHVIEACVMTGKVNHCAREDLGPPPETVTTRLRPITVWVSRPDRPDEPVTGLGPGDFTLTRGMEKLDGRIVSVSENSTKDSVGICLAYLFDMSGSMLRSEGQTALLVNREDGTPVLAPAVRERFAAFADVMKETNAPGAARPDKDMILGAVFAFGLISIGPIPASQADTLPDRIEKVLVREYTTSRDRALWLGTALRENVALTATLLNQAASCKARKKAIAVDTDLMQTPYLSPVNLNEKTLESTRRDYAQYDSDGLLAVLGRKESLTVPVYVFKAYGPQDTFSEAWGESFVHEIVEPSGGEAYHLATRSPEEIRSRLQTLFGRILAHITSSYDLFWNPEGIEKPEEVVVTTKTAGTHATFNMPTAGRSDVSFAQRVLLDRAELKTRDWEFRYNNIKKLTATMFIRKRIEEGKKSPASRWAIRKAIEQERGLPAPSTVLIKEMELALCALAEEEIKYEDDSGTILNAARDLESVGTVPEVRLLEIAAAVPPDVRMKFCKSRPPAGRADNVVRAHICPTK